MSRKYPKNKGSRQDRLADSPFASLPLDTYASSYHFPVLIREVLTALNLHRESPSEQPRLFLDCTLGGGGHSLAILQHSKNLRLYSIDRDPNAIDFASTRLESFHDRWQPLLGNYRDARQLLDSIGVTALDGLLLDAGVSSHQLDDPQRGFSFQHDGPLDMRMGPDATSISDWLAAHDEEEVGRVIADYGEMNGSFRIARAIKRAFDAGCIKTTGALADTIRKEAPPIRRGDIDSATLVFQALRIAINQELEGLTALVDDLPSLLRPGGRIAIISFHSLEDRVVKHGLSKHAATCLCPPGLPICACQKVPEIKILTKRPIVPQEDEVNLNPRSRSAKLRVAERLATPAEIPSPTH